MPERVRLAGSDLDPLVRRAGALAGAGARRLLGVAGPPGAGKSTLAAALVDALAPAAALVPMDGFHLAGSELHRLGRQERKGAVDTFDAAGFVSLLRRLRSPGEETVWAPRFDRGLEEPIAGAIAVPPAVRLVITEGNYLLAEVAGFAPVRGLLDEVWYLELPESLRLERLISRHVAHGWPPALARERVTVGSDGHNAALVAATRHRADLLVRVDGVARS